ncbi:hypothetical protein Esti_005679 [Eimeria stiedai]
MQALDCVFPRIVLLRASGSQHAGSPNFRWLLGCPQSLFTGVCGGRCVRTAWRFCKARLSQQARLRLTKRSPRAPEAGAPPWLSEQQLSFPSSRAALRLKLPHSCHGYGPKDDTWESRKNLLMNSTFAFRHQMDQMEREFLDKRTQGSNRKANKGGAAASGARATADKNKERRSHAGYLVPVEETGTVSDSSSSSASDFSCPKERRSSSSSNSSEGFASDTDSSLVGQEQAASSCLRKSSRLKSFSRRRRRCIDDLVEAEGAPISGALLPKSGGDPGLPASSDSEVRCRGALQVFSGKVGSVGFFSAQQGPLNASSLSVKHGGPPGGPVGAPPSPTKKVAGVGSTPSRRLRYGGGGTLAAQAAYRSGASGGASGAPSSSWKSSPEAETEGAPKAPTGFTVNEPSDDDVAGSPFFAGPHFDGGTVAAPSNPQTQGRSWASQAVGRGPPVSPSLFQSPGAFFSNSGEGVPGDSFGWVGQGPPLEPTWAEGTWASAAAPVCEGAPKGASSTQDAAMRSGFNWGVSGDLQRPPSGLCLSPVGADSSLYCKQGATGVHFEYVGDACSTPPPEDGPDGPPEGAPHGGPCGSGAFSDAAVTPGMGTASPFLAAAQQERGPFYSYGIQQGSPSPYGSPNPELDLAVPPDPRQQQLLLRQQCRYQQVLCVGSVGPLGMSKGMLNRYPCESLYPGRVRIVKIVRAEAGGGSSEWLGGRGALVHYVIASSPGPAADPSRNVWGSCSIADARRFCPGALCDFLLRRALFRSGDKACSNSSSKPAGGPPPLTTNTYTCSSTSTASSDVAASSGITSSVSTDDNMLKETLTTTGPLSPQAAGVPDSEPTSEGGPLLLLPKGEPAVAQQQLAPVAVTDPSAQVVAS